jgi:acyl carrier protein
MATVLTRDEVEAVVTDALEELGVDRSQITRDATLEDLDVDSLDVVELAQVIDERFGVDLRGDEAKDLNTVGAVIDLVVSRSS